jgi:hypothetical protein
VPCYNDTHVEVPSVVPTGNINVTCGTVCWLDTASQAVTNVHQSQQTYKSRLAVNNDPQQLPPPPHVYTRRPRETSALSGSKGKRKEKEAFSHLFIQA